MRGRLGLAYLMQKTPPKTRNELMSCIPACCRQWSPTASEHLSTSRIQGRLDAVAGCGLFKLHLPPWQVQLSPCFTRALTHSSLLQANLSLYTVTALLILDSEGQRVLAKYYNPPHPAPGQHTGGIGTGEGSGLSTLKEQKAFEKSVHEKTKRGGACE